HDALKVRAVATNSGAQRAHIGARRRWRGRARGNKGGAAASLKDRKRARGNIAADGLEHRIDILNHLAEVFLVVVDHLICAEVFDIAMVGGTGRRYDAGTDVFGNLDGITCHAAGAALNENGLAALKLDGVFD